MSNEIILLQNFCFDNTLGDKQFGTWEFEKLAHFLIHLAKKDPLWCVAATLCPLTTCPALSQGFNLGMYPNYSCAHRYNVRFDQLDND